MKTTLNLGNGTLAYWSAGIDAPGEGPRLPSRYAEGCSGRKAALSIQACRRVQRAEGRAWHPDMPNSETGEESRCHSSTSNGASPENCAPQGHWRYAAHTPARHGSCRDSSSTLQVDALRETRNIPYAHCVNGQNREEGRRDGRQAHGRGARPSRGARQPCRTQSHPDGGD